VVDLAGRRVRHLLSGVQPAGTLALTWDGRDEAGRAVGAGLYFYVLDIEGRQVGRRIVLTR
jgi:flagellar hook assembly protein FlgD